MDGAPAEPPPVRIRAARPGDEAALERLGQATFLEAYAGILPYTDIAAHCARQHAAARYREWLEEPGIRIWIAEAERGAAPVGYLVLGPPDLPLPDLSPRDREIRRIYLLARFQRSGCGRRLMATAVAEARADGAGRLLLGVYEHNAAAIGFYRRLGFETVGERTFHVGEHDYHDLILGLPLAPTAGGRDAR